MVRIKYRYLLVDILFPNAAVTSAPALIVYNKPCPNWFDIPSFLRLIRANIAENFGDYGTGVLGGSLSIKYFSPATATAIIRCPRAHYRLVWAALTYASKLSRHVDKRDEQVSCIFRVVRVSGTMKKVEEEAIRRARKQILEATSEQGIALDSMFSKDSDSEEANLLDEDVLMEDHDSEEG